MELFAKLTFALAILFQLDPAKGVYPKYEVARDHNKTIRIGYVAATKTDQNGTILWDALRGGALLYAVEKINNDTNRLPGYKIEVVRIETNGLDDISVKQTMDICMNRDDIDVIVGVGNTCETQARIASASNIPMLSHNCEDAGVSQKMYKEQYASFARTRQSLASVARAGIALLKYYEWTKHIALLWMNEGDKGAAETVKLFKELADQSQIKITQEKAIKHPDNLRYGWFFHDTSARTRANALAYWTPIIDEVKQRSRIFVYVMSGPHEVLSLAYAMDELGLLGTGDYQLIVLKTRIAEIFDPNAYLFDSAFRTWASDEVKSYIHELQRHILVVGNTVPVTDVDMMLKFYWYNRFWTDFWESTYNRKVSMQGRPYAIIGSALYSLYDLAYLYAGAVERLIASGSRIRDGRALFNVIKNTSYVSSQGWNVHIDAYGDIAGNYSLYAFRNDSEHKPDNLWPVGTFHSYDDSSNLLYVAHTNVEWPGGKKPEDTPPSEHCPHVQPHLSQPAVYVACGILSILLMAMVIYCALRRQPRLQKSSENSEEEKTYLEKTLGIGVVTTSQRSTPEMKTKLTNMN